MSFMSIVALMMPVFVLIGLGWLAQRLSIIPPAGVTALNQFVFKIGLPALIFMAIAACDPVNLQRTGFLSSVTISIFLCFFAVQMLFMIFLRQSRGEAALLAMLGTFPNVMFAGVPILTALFPEQANEAVLACTLVHIIEVPQILMVMLILECQQGEKARNRRHLLQKMGQFLVSNPVMWASVLGLFVCLTQMPLPDFAVRVLRMLGNTVAPCALMALGMVVASHLALRKVATEHPRPLFQLIINAAKLVMQPLVIWIALTALNVDPLWRAMGILLAAMPTGTVAYIISENYGVATKDASFAILINTGASLLVIPLLVFLLQG